MRGADHCVFLILTLLPIIQAPQVVISSTYQRGTRVCRPVFNCHQGYQIKECSKSEEKETCEACPDGQEQPDLISSVLEPETYRKCFVPQQTRCSKTDTVPVREKDEYTYCGYYCKCDITKCYFGKNSCECVFWQNKTCPPNTQLHVKLGGCVPCPDLMYKNGYGCGPCQYNETAFSVRMNDSYTYTPVPPILPPQPTPSPTTDKVNAQSTPVTPPHTSEQDNGSGSQDGLSSTAIVIIAVLVFFLLTILLVMVIVYCCYCKGTRCRQFLNKANGQLPVCQQTKVKIPLNGILQNGHARRQEEEKLYEDMGDPPSGRGGECETLLPRSPLQPSLPQSPPLPPCHPSPSGQPSPTGYPRPSGQPSPTGYPRPNHSPPIHSTINPSATWISSGYESALASDRRRPLCVALPRQISQPVQDTTPHTPPVSAGSSDITSHFETMEHWTSDHLIPPPPGLSQEPIQYNDPRVSNGSTMVKQQSPITCTEAHPLHFPTISTNMSTQEFAHQRMQHFQPGVGYGEEHGDNPAKENEEETQPKHGEHSVDTLPQKAQHDGGFVTLPHDHKHPAVQYKDETEQDYGANNIPDMGKPSTSSYFDMDKTKNADNFVNMDETQSDAYESVAPPGGEDVISDTKDNSEIDKT